MSEITINRAHNIGLAQLRRRATLLEQKLQERFGVTLEWRGDRAHFCKSGVTGFLALGESHVSIYVKLGLLARPWAARIQDGVERHLDMALG